MSSDYNKCKWGMDGMDQMSGNYTSQMKTKRWTEAFFYNMQDVAGLSAYVIYKDNTREPLERRKF